MSEQTSPCKSQLQRTTATRHAFARAKKCKTKKQSLTQSTQHQNTTNLAIVSNQPLSVTTRHLNVSHRRKNENNTNKCDEIKDSENKHRRLAYRHTKAKALARTRGRARAVDCACQTPRTARQTQLLNREQCMSALKIELLF